MKTTDDKTVRWKFAHSDYPKVYATSWKLIDDEVYRIKCEQGVPKWIGIELMKDEQFRNDLKSATDSSSLDDSAEPGVVSSNIESTAPEPSATELRQVHDVLEQSPDVTDVEPESKPVARPVSRSARRRANVQKSK